MLNGVGGKVDDGESDRAAMIREFEEETGVHYEEWKEIASISDGTEFKVTFYAAVDYDAFQAASTTEKETIVKSDIRGRGDIVFSIDASCVYNLNWLIPLALDEKIIGPVELFYMPNSPSTGIGNFSKPELEKPTLEPQHYKEGIKAIPDNGGSDDPLHKHL